MLGRYAQDAKQVPRLIVGACRAPEAPPPFAPSRLGGELLVGEASGGGVDGASQVATDAAVAGLISLVAILLSRRWPRAMLVVLTLFTVLAAGAAWYTAMSFVFGSAAYALSRQFSGSWRKAGTFAGIVASSSCCCSSSWS